MDKQPLFDRSAVRWMAVYALVAAVAGVISAVIK